MNYEEAKQYLETVNKSGINLGLTRMEELCKRLGNPEKKLKFIHVAGTNGKGSTAAYISSILAVNGHWVGRYVSPVVFQYEECIQYENPKGIHYIDKELLAEVVTEVAKASESMKAEGLESPTIFEFETAMALLAFVRWECSVVVLEVGLGGREDATNIIENVLASVITPISMDHMAMLGDTLTQIATEKAGIIKEKGTVITYQTEKEALFVIQEKAGQKEAKLTEVKKEDIQTIWSNLEGSLFSYQGENFRTFMTGIYQVENACLAIETCRHLPEPFTFDIEQIILGIRMAQWRGRFEVICTDPLIIIDGAHNPAGAKALANSIKELLPDRTLRGVMGVFKDKEYKKIVEELAEYFTDMVTITPTGERGLEKEKLAKVWEEKGCQRVSVAENVMEGLKQAIKRSEKGDAILLFGSLSFFKELKWKDN